MARGDKNKVGAMKLLAGILGLIACVVLVQGCDIGGANFSAAKGKALYDVGRYEEAVQPLKKAIDIRPEHGRAHYYLALTYLKLGRKQEAVSLLGDYLQHIGKTDKYIGPLDREAIPKCEELLNQLKQK